jgi:putative phosphoribosyl transferase
MSKTRERSPSSPGVNHDLVRRAGVTPHEVDVVERRERELLERRVARYRRGRDRVPVAGRVAVVVDDGVATGATATVACEVARHLGAARVVLAVPVASADSLTAMAADETECVATPEPFVAVGRHYRDFSTTGDDEVVALLDAARRRSQHRAEADCDEDVEIPIEDGQLSGHLHLPRAPRGVVLFAHGSGSSRHSPRNRLVAATLADAGLGTLLLDLLTPGEEGDRSRVFDIDLLAGRLLSAVGWLRTRPAATSSGIGFFGASTGAAAALVAAAQLGTEVGAVVSRGGRPDLAGRSLGQVRSPTLLIVGGADQVVLELNRQAQAQLRCPSRLAVVEGASHLFEEPGALPEAARLARDWFLAHLEPQG